MLTHMNIAREGVNHLAPSCSIAPYNEVAEDRNNESHDVNGSHLYGQTERLLGA